MTKAELDAIRERESLATQGPWEWTRGVVGNLIGPPAPNGGRPDVLRYFRDPEISYLDARDEDRRFIAASRTDVPALLAEVERLRGIVESAGLSPDTEWKFGRTFPD